ncbi:MAG: hypothetical protein LBH60_05790 [Prevotellaceae bacterium]|jgi:hypothetical protein|nr:hypothetical protein [Prevotellaceae bacterium]
MKKLRNIILFFFCCVLSGSCIDSEYDLDNIDDSGGLSPALTLPIGTVNTYIIDLIRSAGIEDPLITCDGNDTIFIEYEGSMPLTTSDLDFAGGDIITDIPEGINFSFGETTASIDIDIFKNLAAGGSVIILSNPQIYFTMRNYMGVDITVDINGIKSEGNGQSKSAVFSNGATSYSIDIEGAESQGKYSERTEIFNRTNGRMNELFAIAPERILYDFGVTLTVPDDGKPHFIMKDNYIDVKYKLRAPLTFGPGTRLAGADTLDFDLSGDGFVNNIENLTLWIDYVNSLRTTVDLDILFLDEYKREIPGITRHFHMNAAAATAVASTKDNYAPGPGGQPAAGKFSLSFNRNEFDDAQKAKYVVLKSIMVTDNRSNGDVNIHLLDYIKLKLSAYSKVNI